ncbi:PTS fructose transporter subunit IIA, partial [bacterium]|nr:PTS fructose transporter subunit IIA [bacterium]
MVGLILVAHGNLANELLNTTAMILGEALTSAVGVPVNAMDDPESITDRIEQAIEQVNTGRGVLILTDMFGGTPSNLAISVMENGHVEVVAGMNLPMLI